MNDNTQGLTEAEARLVRYLSGGLPSGAALDDLATVKADAYATGLAARGELVTCPECRSTFDAHDLTDWQASRAAARGDAATEATERVQALADEWEREAGPESESWRVFGPQVVSIPFAVNALRAACDPVPAPTQGTEPYEEPNQ